ncbi:hypothetical protein OSTOST_23108 [Ostertagia ostertagi]
MQIVVADTAGCCQKTVSNIIARVVDALAHPDIVQQFIKFKPEDEQWCRPDPMSLQGPGGCPVSSENVIGAVDGTLVRIRTPAVDGYQYVSRKGTSCLNVCFIADAVGRVLYVNTGSPGSVHDSIFGVIPPLRRSSTVEQPSQVIASLVITVTPTVME